MSQTARVTTADQAAELGSFLMARRQEIDPAALGLPVQGRRRVSGLRREEVAAGASISTDYYARIEQGRRPVTEGVLAAICDVLGLNARQRSYAFQLAGISSTAADDQPGCGPGTALPLAQTLIDTMTTAAVIVQNRRYDIVATNALGRAVFAPVLHGTARPNMARFAFLDPAARDFFGDWAWTVDETVVSLRVAAADPAHRRELTELVGELAVSSDEFRTRWAATDVRSHPRRFKIFHHPLVGSLQLNFLALQPLGTELRIYSYLAEPGSASEEALTRLAAGSTETNGEEMNLFVGAPR